MGTITTRKRKDGTMAYTARVRITHGGNVIHQETQTFDRKQAASAWIKKRETELSEDGALEAIYKPTVRLGDVIHHYLDQVSKTRKYGRTKFNTLRAIAKHPFGSTPIEDLSSSSLVAYVQRRIAEDKVLPQTACNDIAILASVYSVAEPAWGYKIDYSDIRKARAVLERLGIWARSKERDRIPTMQELDTLMTYFADQSRRRKWVTPMLKIIAFAIYSTRRQEEIIRIRWDGLNEQERTVLVTDVKHPRRKWGNHKHAKLTDEAWAIIQSMPRVSEFIFPFTTDAVAAQFQRACKWLEIDDLHFHDLRRAGVTRLFEMGWDIPHVTQVSLHEDWHSLKRYVNLKGTGDRYEGWAWLQKAIDLKWEGFRKGDGQTRSSE